MFDSNFLVPTVFLGFIGYKFIKNLYWPKLKSFEDEYQNDEYNLLSYCIVYKDNTKEDITSEITNEDIEEKNDEKQIKYIKINYMCNCKLYKYITYSRDTSFPIYDSNVNKDKQRNIEKVFINDEDVTYYIKPYLGPKNNFYIDKSVNIKLEDILESENINLKEGKVKIITDDNEVIEHDLPWRPVWKPYAGNLDKTVEMNEFINNSVVNKYGFVILNKD